MKHSISTRKELTILKLEEQVFDVRHAEWFRTTIDTMVSDEASKNIIVDFSQVKAIDSSGIGSILLAHQRANSSEGLAIFVSLCQQIKDLLKLANLDKQLFIFSSINEVMTLIEPALKGKRASKARRQQSEDDNDGDDEVNEEIDILPDDAYDSESFDDMNDETTDDSDEREEGDDEAEVKPHKVAKTPKKRGRPKKNSQPVKAVRKKSEHLD
ncbi:MAG TPA: STAS domain-containing protein [Chlorobaculum parvum]|uniref:STAS domain-containing protein n=1 Tax=Chlorobaculum parvum TaxID=274539 RepID=A0A7C5HNU2_9CHLB|nr:STAS domain-containing protein [Chlorobaculum parvum]